MKLRPYQQEVVRAVIDSIQLGKGLTISVEIARQGGKNELSAHLEVLLMTLFMSQGGSLIKCSPTFKPQTVISMQRLKERLNEFGFDGIYHTEMGYIIVLNATRAIFLSAEESSSVVGHTADILLEIDIQRFRVKAPHVQDHSRYSGIPHRKRFLQHRHPESVDTGPLQCPGNLHNTVPITVGLNDGQHFRVAHLLRDRLSRERPQRDRPEKAHGGARRAKRLHRPPADACRRPVRDQKQIGIVPVLELEPRLAALDLRVLGLVWPTP